MKITEALVKAGITVPEDIVDSARYIARTDDWYVLTRLGWLWWDARTRKWVPSEVGPP